MKPTKNWLLGAVGINNPAEAEFSTPPATPVPPPIIKLVGHALLERFYGMSKVDGHLAKVMNQRVW